MSKHKVLHRAFFGGNTVVTLSRPIVELKIGDTINNGSHKIVSVVLSDSNNDDISLVVNGKFMDDEVIYGT